MTSLHPRVILGQCILGIDQACLVIRGLSGALTIIKKKKCRGGLLVKASGFHPDNPGSIPGAAKISPRKLAPTSSGRSAHPRTDILTGYGAGLAGDGWPVE